MLRRRESCAWVGYNKSLSYPYIGVVELVVGQVDDGKHLNQLEQHVLSFELGHAVGEPESLEQVAHVFREVAQVGCQVLPDVLLVSQQAR